MAWRVDACQIERVAMGRYSYFESLSEPGAEPIGFQGTCDDPKLKGWIGLDWFPCKCCSMSLWDCSVLVQKPEHQVVKV